MPSAQAPVKTKQLQFSINGEFITQIARQKLYEDYNLKSAIDLVMSVTVTDEMSYEERLGTALLLLDGKYSLTGTYPNSDYGMVEHENYQPLGIFTMLEKLNEKVEMLKTALNDERSKTSFLLSRMEPWEQDEANTEYYEVYNEPLFGDVTAKQTNPIMNRMLESFLARQKNLISRCEDGTTDDDYGWLAPDGTFYPVEWGEHDTWADKYLAENHPEEKARYEFEDGLFHPARDILIYKMNWILMHNPYQGIAFPTMAPAQVMTESQKNTLYDYYMARNMDKEANALYQDDN